MATRAQFRHEDVATVPRGWKVRTVTQRTGHQARIAFPPGPRRKGAGRLISILHPQGENPETCREGRRLKAEGSNPRGAALTSILHKPSGKRYWLHVKRAWGKVYYSFDGENWHPSKVAAFKHAEAKGALQESAGRNPRGKVKTREQVEKMQAKAVKFLRDVVGNDDKADEIEALSLDDYAAKKKITLGNPKKSKVKSRKSKSGNPLKSGYRAWLKVRGGFDPSGFFDRYGSQVFKTRREALVDAAKIIREVKNDPDVTWRHDIETYGSVRDLANPHISQAWDQASGRYRAQVLGMAGIGEPERLAALSWKELPKQAKDALTGKAKKNKFDTPREKAAFAAAGLSSGSRRLGGALETLRRKRATRLERMTGRGLGRRNPPRYSVKVKIVGTWRTKARTDDLQVAEQEAARWRPTNEVKIVESKNPKRRQRNAADDQGVSHERTAKALYRKFHGKAPKEVLELQESAAMRGEYASLGDLVELVVKSPAGDSLRIGFEGEKVKLASSPNGGQLYFLGGNQALDGTLSRFKTDATKDLVDLGEAQSIVYRAAKDFTGFKSSDWEHAFGEESGERPSAFYDKLKRRIFLVGGTYRVERPGIVD